MSYSTYRQVTRLLVMLLGWIFGPYLHVNINYLKECLYLLSKQSDYLLFSISSKNMLSIIKISSLDLVYGASALIFIFVAKINL